MSDLERQELLADMRHRTALHCGSNHHETVLMVEMIDRLRVERDALAAQVAQMREALEQIAEENERDTDAGWVARCALALPTTAAEERVLAEARLGRAYITSMDYVPGENIVVIMDDRQRQERELNDALTALRALDGKAGESGE